MWLTVMKVFILDLHNYVKSEKYPIENLLFCVKNGQVALLGICLKKEQLRGLCS